MTPFDRARHIFDDAAMDGALGSPYEPFAPIARWRVSPDVFEGLKEQMQRDILGPYERLADNVSLTLLGKPLDVAEDAAPDTMELVIQS